ACDSYTWSVNGQSYTQSGTYTSVNGCHTETLNLTVNPSLGDSVASVDIGIVQATPGAVVSVPVIANSLVDISSFQFGIYFDSGVLTYQNVRSGHSLTNQVVLPSLTGNRVDVAYIDFTGNGYTACGDTILWIDFVYSAQGGISPLVWDMTYTQVSGLTGNALADLRLSDGMVYGSGVTTSIPSTNGNQSVCEFSDVTFSVSASGISSYQWMVSTDGGSSFVSLVDGNGVSGAQSDSLALTSVLSGMDGNIYMCRVNGLVGAVASLVQRLDVRPLTSTVVQLLASPIGLQCSGTAVTYSVQGVTVVAPVYHWLVNGVVRGSGTTLVRSDLVQGDVVSVEVTSGSECVVASGSAVAQVSSLPVVQLVTGGGSYCPGTNGASIELLGSQTGVRYYLIHNGTSTGDTLLGTGSGLSFT
ncbi:MAG: cohesin domain-containing protein, partial [Bacteroidota bacterium]